MNPARRRRKRRRVHGHRRRRSYRRYARRRYRRNPGGMFMDMAKRALPVALSFLASRMIVNKVGPMLPFVSTLGSFSGVLMSSVTAVGAHFATQKIGALAKHRQEIMSGAILQVFASAWSAFAPASIQSMLGDYVQMGDYVAVGGAPPLREDFTLSDYIAVGGDGVSEELGLEEELGVEEELGNVRLGGLPGPTNGGLLKPVPTMSFVQPIPARSFTKQIPAAGTAYDNAGQVYTGIFAGKFGG